MSTNDLAPVISFDPTCASEAPGKCSTGHGRGPRLARTPAGPRGPGRRVAPHCDEGGGAAGAHRAAGAGRGRGELGGGGKRKHRAEPWELEDGS